MRRVRYVWLGVLICLTVSVSAVLVPQPATVYVGDYANLLSDEVKNEIIAANQSLYHRTGAQIVVITVNWLDEYSIDQYAYELFSQWGIGDSQRNNGLLLLICASERSYYVLQGAGIAEDLTALDLQEVMERELVPSMSTGDYNSGVQRAFDTLCAWFEEYYEGTHYVLAVNTPSDLRGAPRPRGPGQSTVVGDQQRTLWLVVLLLALVLLPIWLDASRYRKWKAEQALHPEQRIPYKPFLFGRGKRQRKR